MSDVTCTVNPDSQNYFITLYIAGWVIRRDIHQRILILTEAIAEANIGIQWWISTSYPIPQ